MTDVVLVGMGIAATALDDPGEILEPVGHGAGPFDPAAVLGRGVRYKDRATQLALVAADRALADARLWDAGGAGIGVVASSNLGNLDTVCRTAEVIATESVVRTHPMDLANASSNVIAFSIAIAHGLRGPNVLLCNGESGGLDAVHLAARLIVAGRATRMVVVGVEPANDVVAELLGLPVALLFDGAVAVVLESAVDATARGVAHRARIGRYARRADPYASVNQVLDNGARPGLWLAGAIAAAPGGVVGIARRDVAATCGPASGALGVLQVAAGTHWLGSGGRGPVLATAGTTGDGVSSLLLVGTGAAA